MNNLTLLLIVVTTITFSCNNSQTTNYKQSTETQQKKVTIISEETEIKTSISKVNNKKLHLKTRLIQVIKPESAISWADFYKQIKKQPQTFSINNNLDTILTCLEGTTIKIGSNSFVSEQTNKPISGKIKIIVTEYYKLSDILLSNLTTASDNSILETGGMLHISAVSNNENCKIKEGSKLEIGFPTKTPKEDMQLFTGNWNEKSIDWKVDTNSLDLNKMYNKVDVMPLFPGGDEKLRLFLSNIKYPIKAVKENIQGIVYIRVTINREGKVTEANILKGIDPECDKEALNTVLKFPKLKPALINGENVNFSYTLSVNFSLDDETTKNDYVKQEFEKTFNDSTIYKAHSSYLTSYLFSTSNLGWINCDRFIYQSGEKVDLIVKLDHKNDVKIIFHSIKSVMSSFPLNEEHVFNNIPKGEKITIIAIKNIDKKPHLAIKETVTSSSIETDFIFQPITMEALKNEMKKLDRLK